MKKIKILLTFDYELPLGYSIDYEKGLFAPAASLLQRAKKLQVPLVLFADVCSAIRFQEWDHLKFYKPFVAQLQRALTEGHDVQLHIHPHWMTSTFSNGAFRPSLDYSLSQFSAAKNELTIENIIDQAFNHLSEICKAVQPSYRCIAYRAGGYDIGPESPRILRKLDELGIGIDSSVIKGYYLDYGFSKVDYSNSPPASRWKVALDGRMTSAAAQGIHELPVTSKPLSIGDLATRRIRKLTNSAGIRSRAYAHGGKGFLAQHGGQTLRSSLRKVLNPIVLSFDKEYMDHEDLAGIVDYNVRMYAPENEDLVITAIGHPKSMGEYHLDVLEKFVVRMRQRYGQQVSFVTYPDIQSSL